MKQIITEGISMAIVIFGFAFLLLLLAVAYQN